MKFSDGANIVICGEVLGIGAYAEVRVALHKATQNLVAAKIFDLERGLEKSISREIKILNKLRKNKYVVQLLEVVPSCNVPIPTLEPALLVESESKIPTPMCVLVEELAVTDLFSIIAHTGAFPESLARSMFYNLISAVDSLHMSGIIHLDIKPENILFSPDFELKLCDFGLSFDILEDSSVKSIFEDGFSEMTPYIAPELINEHQVLPSCDIWSCAVVLYIVLTGRPPFRRPVLTTTHRAKRCKLFTRIIGGKYPTVLSDLSQDLLSKIFRMNPDDRLTADEILSHPWFDGPTVTSAEWHAQMEKRISLFKSLDSFGSCRVHHSEEGEV